MTHTLLFTAALAIHTLLENVEHCGGEPEQAVTMATCT